MGAFAETVTGVKEKTMSVPRSSNTQKPDQTTIDDATFVDAEAHEDATFVDAAVHEDATCVDAPIREDATVVDAAAHEDATFVDAPAQEDATFVDASAHEDATFVDAPVQEDATVVDAALPEDATIVDSPRDDDATFVDSPGAETRDLDATYVESGSTGDNDATLVTSTPNRNPSELDVQTVIGDVPHDPHATFAEISATAGSSSVARGWAATQGASEAEPSAKAPGTKPTSAPRGQNTPRAEDRYKLLDNFAHGGLGNIWLAEDTSIRRQIAFKELLPKALKNRSIVERFMEEAQITGQLEHPCIVPIYDMGYQENGTPFYAMKLLKGGNMEKAIEDMHTMPRGSTERQLAFTRLLRQVISVCQAMGYAHGKGVLHRDLKPLNVMLGEFGETLVLDWGLAKVIDVLGHHEVHTNSEGQADKAAPSAAADDGTIIETQTSETNFGSSKTSGGDGAGATKTVVTSPASAQAGTTEAGTFLRRQVATDARTAGSHTMMGQIMGTPAYMPAEQAQGKINQLDARTDIYSLGGILYKLLTNQSPIGRGKPQEVLKKVIAGEITPPRQIDPTIPPPLEAICQKAMALKQEDRYQQATDMAADIEAWLSDEPVSVYPDPWHERFRRWRKRHRTLVFSSSVAVILLVVGSIAWTALESHRVETLRLAAQTKVDDARAATEAADLIKANSLLTEALGQVKAESKLALLRDRIQSDLENIARLQAAAEHERLSELRSKAARLFEDAKKAGDTDKDFAQARTLLTEAVTLLAGEASLADVHRQAQSRLAEVNQVLAQQSEVIAAKAQLAKFQDEVEQVRVYSGNISGEDSVDDLREARQHGLAALELFAIDFEQPKKLDARLRLLGPEAIETWKAGLLELLVTIAQAETNLAIKDQPQDVTAAATRSLKRVEQAEAFGLASRPVGFLKADLLATVGQAEAAEKMLAIAEKLPAVTRLDHYWLAERARQLRQFPQAIQHLQDALRVDPDDFWSLNLMGICHLFQGQPAAAAANFTACIARRPNLVWPYLSRGIAFADLGQFENSHLDLARAEELSPRAYAVPLNRGFVFFLQKNFDAAKADFTTAAERRPDLAAPHLNLAEAFRRQAEELELANAADGSVRAAAERQTALAELTKALTLAPQQGAIYRVRGMIRVRLNDPAAAIADFQRATKLESSEKLQALSFYEIGAIHQRAKRLPESLAAFDESLKLNPLDTKVIRERAEVLLSLRKFDAAIAGFSSYLEKAGPLGDVYRARGLAYSLTNKPREAINDYTMSLQYEPSLNMLGRRGWAYLLNSAKLAKEDFEEAVRLDPLNPDSLQGLAYATVTLGDHAAAVANLEKAAPIIKNAPARLGVQAWPLSFNQAATYSQAYAKAVVDPTLSPERREALTKQYVTQAIAWLTEAHTVAGPQYRAVFSQELRGDGAFDPIRTRPEFIEAMKTLTTESK
ncbi:MAG: protein kinase domain-containing protein [Planctomycetaceae bacterium]